MYPQPQLAGRTVRRQLDVRLRLRFQQANDEIEVVVRHDDGRGFSGTEGYGVSCDLSARERTIDGLARLERRRRDARLLHVRHGVRPSACQNNDQGEATDRTNHCGAWDARSRTVRHLSACRSRRWRRYSSTTLRM